MPKTATKQLANEALGSLKKLADALPQDLRTSQSGHLLTLEEFIMAAVKRLPTQAAVDRDRIRKKR